MIGCEKKEKIVEADKAVKAVEKAKAIEVWYHTGRSEEREVLDAQVAAFNKSHQNTPVKLVKLPEGSYNDQVNAAAMAKDLPCLLDFDGPNLYNYAWSGYLKPLDGYVSKKLKDDFLPSIIAQGTYGGKLYSLGVSDSGLAIWGNKKYLEKAGVRIPKGIHDAWTKEEFVDALKRLQALEEVEYAIDFKMNYGVGEWFTYGFSPLLQSFGGDLIDRKTYKTSSGVLNSTKSVEAMTFFRDIFKKGYSNSKPAGDDDFYVKKITALSWVGHWVWANHKKGLGDDLVLIPMPKFGNKAVTGMGTWNWGVTSTCENPDVAWKFLEYLISPEQVLKMSDASGAVPSRKSAIAKSKLYAKGGALEIFTAQLENAVAMPRPVTPAYPVITSSFSEAVKNIVAGSDVKAELDKAVQKIDQDIQDNKGYPVNL